MQMRFVTDRVERTTHTHTHNTVLLKLEINRKWKMPLRGRPWREMRLGLQIFPFYLNLLLLKGTSWSGGCILNATAGCVCCLILLFSHFSVCRSLRPLEIENQSRSTG